MVGIIQTKYSCNLRYRSLVTAMFKTGVELAER
jgi:hypothetical protein